MVCKKETQSKRKLAKTKKQCSGKGYPRADVVSCGLNHSGAEPSSIAVELDMHEK